MSWHFSRALVAEYLGENSSDGGLLALSKSIPFAPDDSCSDKMSGTCHRSPFGMMFVPSTEQSGEELLTWLLEDSLVKTLALQENRKESTEKEAGFGVKCSESLAKYDPHTHSWKTAQICLTGELEEFSEKWSNWGMIVNGEYFRAEVSVPPLKENAFLLPSPTKAIAKHGWGISKTGRRRYSEELIKNAMSYGYKPPPEVLEWSMGWVDTWTGCQPLETGKFQQWLRQHGKY